jgi:nitrate/nitrite-specific signal transduction histidine kinase
VAAGELSYQLPTLKSADELAILSQSFNQMTRKYCHSQAEVEAAAIQLRKTVISQDKEIQTLFEISRIITSILDVNQLLQHTLSLSMSMIGATLGIAWLRPQVIRNNFEKKTTTFNRLQPVAL